MTTERAILAGGCFWGMQELIRNMNGVISTRVGYSGGDVPNATYRNHGTHAEAIEVVFDPAKLSYRQLLEFFFQIHDPTTRNRQGNDLGMSYRSAIYYTCAEQERVAEDTIADVDASGLWPGKVVTEVEPAGAFLGSRARASGLSAKLSDWLHLPLCAARMATAGQSEGERDGLGACHARFAFARCAPSPTIASARNATEIDTGISPARYSSGLVPAGVVSCEGCAGACSWCWPPLRCHPVRPVRSKANTST